MLIAGLLLAMTPAPACTPIAGADALWERPATRWIIVGEIHGTAESPRAFADLVCLASANRHVVVALEHPEADQPAIDAWLASDGGEAARAAFLAAGMWRQPMKDGRTSLAMLELFDALRLMAQGGKVKRVVAFQPLLTGPYDPAAHERAMADRWIAASPDAGTLVIALVGNLHALTGEIAFGATRYLPAAAHLPAAATLTLDIRSNGGAMWVCNRDGCGPNASAAGPRGNARGIVLGSAPAYSGVLELGLATTASPPAVP